MSCGGFLGGRGGVGGGVSVITQDELTVIKP